MAHHLNLVPLSRIEELVKELKLEKHPEGGFYSETYRSALKQRIKWSFDDLHIFPTYLGKCLQLSSHQK